jgi:Mg2+/Co2+ transporter CorB
MVSRCERIPLRIEEHLVELKSELNEIMDEPMTLFSQRPTEDAVSILDTRQRFESMTSIDSTHMNVIQTVLNEPFFARVNTIPVDS